MTAVEPHVARLNLLRPVSPTLPIGAYAGSEGLESAVSAAWVGDEASSYDWISGRLEAGISYLDLPILARFYRAWEIDDADALADWSDWLRASRETRELWTQDHSLGRALARLLVDLDLEAARTWQNHESTTYTCMFALAAQRWGVPLEAALDGFAFAWCEAQVAAAIKLVPLGQTAGQRVLARLARHIPACARSALEVCDIEIGESEPGVTIVSAWHEDEYARLFRS